MRRYETMMVLHPELPEAQTRETIDRARRLLEGMGAEINEIEEWGMRDLAYPIRKASRGYYVVADYSAQPSAVNELERTLRLSDEILRYMTVARSKTRRRASAVTDEPRPKRTLAAESTAAGVEDSISGETAAGPEAAQSGARSALPGVETETGDSEESAQ